MNKAPINNSYNYQIITVRFRSSSIISGESSRKKFHMISTPRLSIELIYLVQCTLRLRNKKRNLSECSDAYQTCYWGTNIQSQAARNNIILYAQLESPGETNYFIISYRITNADDRAATITSRVSITLRGK